MLSKGVRWRAESRKTYIRGLKIGASSGKCDDSCGTPNIGSAAKSGSRLTRFACRAVKGAGPDGGLTTPSSAELDPLPVSRADVKLVKPAKRVRPSQLSMRRLRRRQKRASTNRKIKLPQVSPIMAGHFNAALCRDFTGRLSDTVASAFGSAVTSRACKARQAAFTCCLSASSLFAARTTVVFIPSFI